jgi:RNA polymerase sigma-70 factor, ECF subfamily
MTTDEVTQLLQRVKLGDADAESELLSRVYPDLKRLVSAQLRREGARRGLQTTEVVNEAYLRVFGSGTPVNWQDRAHFYAVIAQKVRHILVDLARKRRSGGHISVALDDSLRNEPAPDSSAGVEITALDEALWKLQQQYPRQARVVELRYFGGMTMEEIAEALRLNITTIKRDWSFARAWLYDQLNPSD